jgi:hypothetical protein
MIERKIVRHFSTSKTVKVHGVLRQDFPAFKKKNHHEVQEYKQYK